MNYPDLEICKAIANEFPKSEFVWVLYYGDLRDYMKVVKREDESIGCSPIVCPAPDCEELGIFLFNKSYILEKNSNTDWALFKFKSQAGKSFEASNETQARAEAVKFILATPQP